MIDPMARLRPVTSAALLTGYGTEHGVPLNRLLRNTGVGAPQLTDPAGEITAGQELAIMRNLVAELGDAPGLGLELGARYHASTHGAFGFAVLTSSTLGEALGVGLAFLELSFSFARITLAQDGPHPSIVLDDSTIPPAIRRFHIERDLQALVTVQQDIIPVDLPIRRVEIPFPADPVYDRVLCHAPGAEPVFGAPRAALTLDRAALDMPLPQANPQIAAMYVQQCAQLLEQRRQRGGVSAAVRAALLRRGKVTTQPEIAADLHLSVRTLRRRLAEEDTTFRDIGEETFGLLAEELLDAGLTVDHVAHRLGYSSASAFSYAFKAWKRMTPGRYSRLRRRRSG
ncbi:AraC family transcriptional regulator [Nocardia stercoris]|nr:AraC family transcriptional regulator [Nocardia stercoris]